MTAIPPTEPLDIPPLEEGLRDDLAARSRTLLAFTPAPGFHHLSEDQRQRWGVCPVCHVEAGFRCSEEIRYALGMRPDGVHFARINAAPYRVELRAA